MTRSELDRVRLSGSVWVWALTHRESASFGSVIELLWGIDDRLAEWPAWGGSMSVAGSEGVAGWALFLSLALSLSFARDPEMNWSENESVNSFPGQRSKFWSTGNDFPENRIFRSCQTRGLRGKWFPEIIYHQNKCTLNSFGSLFWINVYSLKGMVMGHKYKIVKMTYP